MRYLALFLFCILVTSNAYGGVLDGKEIACEHSKQRWIREDYVFRDGKVFFWYVDGDNPLVISKAN